MAKVTQGHDTNVDCVAWTNGFEVSPDFPEDTIGLMEEGPAAGLPFLVTAPITASVWLYSKLSR